MMLLQINNGPASQGFNHDISDTKPSVPSPASINSVPAQGSGTFSSTKSGVRKEPSGPVRPLPNHECCQIPNPDMEFYTETLSMPA